MNDFSNFMAPGPFHLEIGRLFLMIFFWQVVFWSGSLIALLAITLAKRGHYKLIQLGVGQVASLIYPRPKPASIYSLPQEREVKEQRKKAS